MAKKKYEEFHIAEIADAIRRELTPSYESEELRNKKYKVSEMRDAIVNGGSMMFESGRRSGYEDGRIAEGLLYWNAITNNGSRSSWDYAFSYSDYSEIEFPKPVVIKESAQRLFRMYAGKTLPKKLDIDMSGVTNVTAMFSYINGGNRIITIPDYGIPILDSYESFCDNSTCIETIEIIRCQQFTIFTNAFNNCTRLINITFYGMIGRSLNMCYSPLSVASLRNIIRRLVNYKGDSNEYTYTLALKSVAFSALEAAGLTDEDIEWFEDFENFKYTEDTTWATVIDDLGWNLTLA